MNNSMNFQSVHSKPFDEARERVRKAQALMQVKQRMIADLPPPGSAMYRCKKNDTFLIQKRILNHTLSK